MFPYSCHSTLQLIQLNIFKVVLTFTAVETRINKYLSEIGYCSRRGADKLLEEGRITINGVQPELGTKVSENDIIAVDGKVVASLIME